MWHGRVFGQRGVALASKYRARSSIRVDESELVRRKAELTTLVINLFRLASKEHQSGRLARWASAQGEQREAKGVVNRGEYELLVLKAQQASQQAAYSQPLKVGFCRVICRNAGGDNEACSSGRCDSLQECLGKQSVRVDVTHTGKWIAATIVRIQAGRFGTAPCGNEAVVQRHLGPVRRGKAFSAFQVRIYAMQQHTLA